MHFSFHFYCWRCVYSTDIADDGIHVHVQYGVTHKENYYVHITKAGKEHVPFLLYIILNVFSSSATIHVRTVCVHNIWRYAKPKSV